MKKLKTIRSLNLSILLAALLGSAVAAPYGPEGLKTQWKQPNGNKLQLRVFGDEYYGRTETSDGHTVVLNRNDMTYYYAVLSADGKTLLPGKVRADQKAPAGNAKHLEIAKDAISNVRNKNRLKFDGERATRWSNRVKATNLLRAPQTTNFRSAVAAEAKANAAPVVGKVKGLTILVQFPRDARQGTGAVNFPASRSKIVSYSNKKGYTEDENTGSVRDYFLDQSLGKLDYTQIVTPIITLPRPRDYYNWQDWPNNRVFRADAGRVLLRDALDVLKAQKFDFSGLTTKNGNEVMATNIFFAGENSGQWSQGLWPHQWNLFDRRGPYNVGTAARPLYVNEYQITNLENSAPVIGTFVHENGHLILDYPDLYDYDGDSQGVGAHCLMGGGNHLNDGKTPGPINAYFKDLVGWANIQEVSPTDYRTLSLRSTGNRAVRLRKPGSMTEFFIVENRGNGDKWASASPDKGIAIWHIDDAVSGNNSQEMLPDLHYQVSLEQSDGRFDLENNINRGDSTDLYSKDTKTFNNTTIPSSKWWDGSPSGINIEVLSNRGSTMQVQFGVVPPNTILFGGPNGGEILYPGSSFPVTWKANVVGNLRIELLKDGVFHSVIAPSVPNTGIYNWTLADNLTVGKNYSVRIRTLTNPVSVSDQSDSTFEISRTSFPKGGTMPYGWSKPQGANSGWVIDKKFAYEGKNSLVTPSIGDAQRAAIAYKSNFRAGFVTFYIKVSSETDYDGVSFYINGKPQVMNGSSFLSGELDWQFVSIPVPAGTHTFMWSYDKDDSYGDLDDKVWIDAVTFPPTTQQLEVKNSGGASIGNDIETFSFSSVAQGLTTRARTFTVTNSGKADLHGLKLSKSGANGADFTVVGPLKKSLKAGQSTTFNVVFSPKSKGKKAAVITLHSNDRKNGKFRINVAGTGLGLPKLVVSQGASKVFKKGGVRYFGNARMGNSGVSRTFTLKNTGSSNLKGLKLAKIQGNKKDFIFGKLGKKSLAPGESTTFTVTFKPTVAGKRQLGIQVLSNDKKTGRFAINLSGKGLPKKKAKAAPAIAARGGSANSAGLVDEALGKSSKSLVHTSTAVEVIGGVKYRSLTVYKEGGKVSGTVEVSPNLLDWYSGSKHTTILVDDATILKVRDNTPLAPGEKRYIRLK